MNKSKEKEEKNERLTTTSVVYVQTQVHIQSIINQVIYIDSLFVH